MPIQKSTEAWIRDLFTNIDNKNTEGFASFLTDDVKFRFGNMPITQSKPSVTEQVSHFFNSIKALRHSIEELKLLGDTILCHGSVTYTRHDDSTLTIPFCNIFKTNPHGIFEYLIFADVSSLYQ